MFKKLFKHMSEDTTRGKLARGFAIGTAAGLYFNRENHNAEMSKIEPHPTEKNNIFPDTNFFQN